MIRQADPCDPGWQLSDLSVLRWPRLEVWGVAKQLFWAISRGALNEAPTASSVESNSRANRERLERIPWAAPDRSSPGTDSKEQNHTTTKSLVPAVGVGAFAVEGLLLRREFYPNAVCCFHGSLFFVKCCNLVEGKEEVSVRMALGLLRAFGVVGLPWVPLRNLDLFCFLRRAVVARYAPTD